MKSLRIALAAGLAIAAAACIPDPTPPDPTTTTTTTTTTTLPAEIAITGSTPASPAASISPRLVGFAPVATSAVRIFTSANCTGSAVASGTLAEFQGAGIAVSVGLGSSTAFTASASGPGVSACSSPFDYVNTLTPPNAYEHEPNGTVAEANIVNPAVGAPADILGVLDGPVGLYNSDNFVFDVEAGRSIRVETFDWSGAACEMLDTKVYFSAPTGQPGGLDDNSGIDLCSLIDPSVDLYAANVGGGSYRVLVQGNGGTYRIRISVLP